MKTYDYIIFDWDGTLAKTPKVLSDSYKEALLKRGLLLTDEHYQKFMMGNWLNGLKNFGVPKAEKTLDEVMRIFSRRLSDVELYDGVENILGAFHKGGKKMALVSTAPSEFLAKADVLRTINRYIDAVITSDDVPDNKLNLFVLEKCLKRLKAKKSKTIYVGNTSKDAVIGREFGVATVIFYPKENEKFYDKNEIVSEKPDYVIREFEELLRIVK